MKSAGEGRRDMGVEKAVPQDLSDEGRALVDALLRALDRKDALGRTVGQDESDSEQAEIWATRSGDRGLLPPPAQGLTIRP